MDAKLSWLSWLVSYRDCISIWDSHPSKNYPGSTQRNFFDAPDDITTTPVCQLQVVTISISCNVLKMQRLLVESSTLSLPVCIWCFSWVSHLNFTKIIGCHLALYWLLTDGLSAVLKQYSGMWNARQIHPHSIYRMSIACVSHGEHWTNFIAL